MKSAVEFIDELALELKPIERLRPPEIRNMLWVAATLFVVTVLFNLTGDFRPGFQGELVASDRFFFETLCGMVAPLFMGLFVLRESIPGRAPRKLWSLLFFLPLVIFAGSILYGFWNPSLDPSMAGKREHCYYETLIFAILPFGYLLFMAKKAAPFQGMKLGLAIGLAAATLPAAFMQIACMYGPNHILSHHILPIGIFGAIGLFAGKFFLKTP